MDVTITGATGLIGRRLVQALVARGDRVIAVSRDPERASAALGVDATSWDDPRLGEAVINLAGENLAQRWTEDARRRIRESRVEGTRRLAQAIARADRPPRVLVSSSAVGYYGDRGDERLTEDAPPGDDFLGRLCVEWEGEAHAAARPGVRVVTVRTGPVLDRRGGALSKMLPFFRLGIGGPVAGGRQYMAWIHAEDVAGIYLRALDDDAWTGAVNATAPEPATNRDFSHALGRALRRPAFAPVPGLAVRLLYGQMAEIVTKSHRVIPARPLALGYEFRHSELEPALRSALA
jgi:uncharacterized protein (TIGR01777 family)